MSLVMKKSFATAKRVISGMEKMSMNCLTFGPWVRKRTLTLHYCASVDLFITS